MIANKMVQESSSSNRMPMRSVPFIALVCTAGLLVFSSPPSSLMMVCNAYQQPRLATKRPVTSSQSMQQLQNKATALNVSRGKSLASPNANNEPSMPSVSSSSSRNRVALQASTAASSSSSNFVVNRIRNWRHGQRDTQEEHQIEQQVEHQMQQQRVHAPKYQWTKQNLAIALPALLGLLADPVLSMVDTAFVGRSGPIDLAALGVCTSIFHMAFTVFRASTVATTSLVGSASSQEEKRQITKISLGFAGVMGSLVLLALRFGGPTMLATMGVSSSSPLYKPACDYLFARCWAAPAVVGIVVAEGAFRGNDDNKTPLIAAAVAGAINLVLDPLLMFPLGMGMAGAAWATALSQFGAVGMYGWRLWKRRLLPQAQDTLRINVSKVLKSILGANAAMLAKNFSMLVFYTAATAVATRLGPVHVASHQVCLSLFWLVTMWLDSGSVSAQLLLSKNINDTQKARSLTKYMAKFALTQGLAFSTIVGGLGRFLPSVFTSDPTVTGYIAQCLPHLALQQTIVSLCLVLEGLAIGGNQFRFTAGGTAISTVVGLWQMSQATSVVDIWGRAVNTFFGMRLVSAVLGVMRVHIGLGAKNRENANEMEEQFGSVNLPPLDTAEGYPEVSY